jgi:hypothetical protein
MDFSATIDLIIKDLKEAGEIIDDLKRYPGVPALQVELAKSKCRSAGEVIALLKTLKDIPSFAGKETEVQQKTQDKKPPVDDLPAPVKEVIMPAVEENKTAEAPVPEMESPPSGNESAPDSLMRKEKESAVVADRFSHLSNTFNEQMGTIKGDEDIAYILKTKHITSLTEAIGLNDKFLFISDIFNGNKTDYNQAISRLESTENITDARAIIMSYKGDNNESEAVTQLLDLVKRKLPSNE